VVVTGVSKATRLKNVPFQVTLINSRDLLQSSSGNLIDNIAKKPGVSSLSTGPAISKPVIRGLGYNRVLTINDEVRQEGQQWGDEHGIEVDEFSVNKIEILKGPASLVYGSDAMAGVINIISNVPSPSNTLKLNLGSGYQSNNRLISNYAQISSCYHLLDWGVYGTLKSAQDYQNKYDGRVLNSRFQEQNFGGHLGMHGSWGYTHLIASSYDMKAGLVEGDRDSLGRFVYATAGGLEVSALPEDSKSSTPLYPYQHIRHQRIVSNSGFNWGKQKMTMSLAWQNNRREEFGNPDDRNERELYFNLRTYTYRIQWNMPDLKGWKRSVGINGMLQHNQNKGLNQLIPDYSLFDGGSFIYLQKEIGALKLSGGIRYDMRTLDASSLMSGSLPKNDAFRKTFSNVSGSAGFAYAVNTKINLKCNLSRAFRAPGIAELASNGAHEGTVRYEYGNLNLKNEISTQSDLAVEYTDDHFSFSAATYYNHFSNFIFYRKMLNQSGQDSMVDNGGQMLTAFTFDQHQANMSGLEFTLDIHPHPLDWLHVENSFSFVQGRFNDKIYGSFYLPFMPAPRLNTEFRADFKKIGSHIRNVYTKFEIENNFSQSKAFTGYNTETSTAGYTLYHFGCGGELVNKNNKTLFGLYFGAVNLTDVAYQSHLSRLKYVAVNPATGRQGVFNMGRNFSIRLNMPLSFHLGK
jgi:iron complex outermembrane receptor protein